MAISHIPNKWRRETDGGLGGRNFKISWTTDFFVIQHIDAVLCLICLENSTVQKEYNIARYYDKKHSSYRKLEGQLRLDNLESLKRKVSGQQSLMKTRFYSSDSATTVSFLISKAIAKNGKPFSDGELIKDCLQIFCAEACPEKSGFARDISLSHQTVARRVEDMSTNIEHTLKEHLKHCEV